MVSPVCVGVCVFGICVASNKYKCEGYVCDDEIRHKTTVQTE